VDHLDSTPQGPGLSRSWIRTASFNGLRVLAWRGDAHVALVGPRRDGRRPTAVDVSHCLSVLERRGVRSAITPALNQFDAQPFLDAGFHLHEHLHLLAARLDDPAVLRAKGGSLDGSLRRGMPWHLQRVLDLDARAFEPFWQFDRVSLREARTATPTSRFRIVARPGSIVGYAVTGKAGDRGYLQRLAVDPAATGQGIATALVGDGFDWLAARGVHSVMVNTQEHNTRALRLYEHLGFVRQNPGLVVLRWTGIR
jgi:ribosomal protein S18 acetylase RimI-like enzyme